MNSGWIFLGHRIYNIIGCIATVEFQSAECPHCGGILTVPCRDNEFDDYHICPFCGKRVTGNPTALEIASRGIVENTCPEEYGLKVDFQCDEPKSQSMIDCIKKCDVCWRMEAR